MVARFAAVREDFLDELSRLIIGVVCGLHAVAINGVDYFIGGANTIMMKLCCLGVVFDWLDFSRYCHLRWLDLSV